MLTNPAHAGESENKKIIKDVAESMPTPMEVGYLGAACKQSDISENAKGFCDGAIEAAYSSIKQFCVPKHITHGEVKAYVKKVLIESEYRSFSAVDFIHYKIHERWYCK